MKKKLWMISASISFALALWIHSAAQQPDSNFIITGQVVDSSGNLVEGALIALDTPPGADIAFRTRPEKNGSFILHDEFIPSLEKRRLYVAGPEPSGAFVLITPPFADTPSWFSLRSLGQEITSTANGKIDVGKITPQVLYGKVKVFLRDHDEKPLIKNKDAWQDMRLRVLDPQENIIAETNIPKGILYKATDFDNSAITVALPEGIWKIEVSLSSGISINKGILSYSRVGTWIKSQDSISLKAGEPQISFYLHCLSSECLNK